MKREKSLTAGIVLALAVLLPGASGTGGQWGPPGERETDPAVLDKLEWFQDLKFGLMMHWGPYSQWGIVESWSLCSEDEPWCRRDSGDYAEYKKRYEALKTTFNPVRFDPARWAEAASAAGMRYVVFTTKHHDGFCMFDTRQTDYRVTDPACPFSADPRANVTREVFEAFRRRGFGIGAYFSKPDWHSPDYWAPEFATPDRNVNYRTDRYPERWERFRAFTHAQVEELMTGYGRVDILWLDGGWVRPRPPVFDPAKGFVPDPHDQDIGLPRLATMARGHQPGLLVVDRSVPGRYENYRTPEQEIPDDPPQGPWETCLTMGTSWSFKPGDDYKPAGRLVRTLVDIVSKGGNLLLNIGPDAEGDFAPEAYARLEEIGAWMRVNGRSIYETRPVFPFRENKVRFTAGRKGEVYAIYLADEDEPRPPAKLMLFGVRPRQGSAVRLLGVEGTVRWEPVGKGCLLHLPAAALARPPCRHAWAFVLTPEPRG